MNRTVATVLAATVPMVMFTGTALASPAPAPDFSAQHVQESFAEQDSKGLEEGLRFIESIPDSALVSDAAWERWKKENLLSPDRASVWGCTSAITIAIVANGFAPAKLLKLKAAMKAAGGAKKVAGMAVKEFQKARAQGKSVGAAVAAAQAAVAVNGGDATQAILLEFFSLKGVIDGCFT